MKVLVCGGRDFRNGELMLSTLRSYFKGPGDTLIHGAARGADQLSEELIYVLFPTLGTIPSIERYPADWDKHGKAAGPIRNRQMLTEGKPDLVIAFPGGKGTANMVKIAREANIEVKEIQ